MTQFRCAKGVMAFGIGLASILVLSTTAHALSRPGPSLMDAGVEQTGGIVLAQSKRELGQGIAQNTLRMDQIEQQMRTLNGRVEELLFEIQRLQEQIRIMQEDNEFRFQELEGEKRSDVGGEPQTDTASSAAQGTDQALEIAESEGSGDDGFLLPDTETQTSATGTGPLDLGAAVRQRAQTPAASDQTTYESRDPLLRENGVASLGTLPLGQNEAPDALYNLGYSQYLNGDFQNASQNLSRFIDVFPDHRLAPNARYWLGETYFVSGQFEEAVEQFSEGYRAYPSSEHAAGSLLKLGLSLAQLNETDAACATLAEMFTLFPNAAQSVQVQGREQQARSNCG
ncbi:MAG: tol-pal system protein YbgF [Pseudomonadota bacterium]